MSSIRKSQMRMFRSNELVFYATAISLIYCLLITFTIEEASFILLCFIIVQLLINHKRQKKIAMTQEELKSALSGVADKLNKAKDEILAALATAGNTSPEVDAAVGKLGEIAQSLDDIVPDAPTPPAEG